MAGTSAWFRPEGLGSHKTLLLLLHLTVLARLIARASSACTAEPTLTTDGGHFMFTLDAKLEALPAGVPSGQSANVASILQSSTGAFQLFVKGPVDGSGGGRVGFYIDTVTGGDGGAYAESTSALTVGQWHTLVVRKDHDQVCLQLDSDANNCSQRTVSTAAEFHMKDAGDISWGTATGLQLRSLLQTPAGHYEYTNVSEGSGSYIQYFLIGVKNAVSDPAVDWFVDTTDPTLGGYVKPKYGNFTRFRMECGYEQEGMLGFFELEGLWTWPAYGLLSNATPASVRYSNVASAPTMPGFIPYEDGWWWSNGIRGTGSAWPTFGGGLWTSVDGVTPSQFSNAFACSPGETSGSGLETWDASSHAGDRKYLRLWVGKEVLGTVTTTTTATCTTTTVTITSTMTKTSVTATTSTRTSSTATTQTSTETTVTVSSTSSSSSTGTSVTSTITDTTSATSTLSTGTSTTDTTLVSDPTTTGLPTTATTFTSTSTWSSTSTSTAAAATNTATSTTATTALATGTGTATGTATGTVTGTDTTTATATVTTTAVTTGTGTGTGTASTSTATAAATATATVTATATATTSTDTSTLKATATGTGTATTSTATTPGVTATTSTATISLGVTATTSTVTSAASSTGTSTPEVTAATSTATTASATTTTITTLTMPSFADVAALLAWVADYEDRLVESFWADPDAKPVTLTIPGASLVAFKVSSSSDASMSAAGSAAAVEVPSSVLSSLGQQEAACVMTTFDSDVVAALSGNSLSSPIIDGAMNLNIFSRAGAKVPVSGLTDPVVLTLPVNRSQERSCSFYDESLGEWSSDGLTEVAPEDSTVDGPLQCRATHMTFFGAILKGFLNTLLCAQVRLFNPESMKQIFRGNWWYMPVAVLFWIVVLCLTSLGVAACVLDHKRRKKGVWGDEFFLIPLQKDAAKAQEQRIKESGLSLDDQVDGDEDASKGIMGRIVDCVLWPFQWCKRSSACRDALDDVVNGWFEYFGELRSFCEAVCEGVKLSDDEDGSTSRSVQILQAVSGSLVLGSARRRTSASLGMSEENVNFIMKDPDLGELLLEAALTLPVDRDRELTQWETRLAAWLDLHKVVLQHFDAHWRATGWGAVPCASSQLFYSANPFVSVFLGCRFWSSSLRVLLFSSELCGAMMMCTVFFTTMFPVPGKATVDPACLGPRTIGERLGRIIAIAMGSGLVAGLPVGLLSSLHKRSFKKVDYEGCPEWNRQLRIWKLQDIALWTLSVAYILFCGFFVCLFLANVDQRALPSWASTNGVTLLQETVLIPLALAVIIPLLAVATLTLAGRASGMKAQDLLSKRKTQLEACPGNMNQLVLRI